jgi:hypothetical protein
MKADFSLILNILIVFTFHSSLKQDGFTHSLAIHSNTENMIVSPNITPEIPRKSKWFLSSIRERGK